MQVLLQKEEKKKKKKTIIKIIANKRNVTVPAINLPGNLSLHLE